MPVWLEVIIMSYKGLRGWLDGVEEMGALRRISGADLDLEIGALYELSRERKDQPALLFENIPGYPDGYRIATWSENPRVAAFTYGLEDGLPLLKATESLREKIADLRRIPPR